MRNTKATHELIKVCAANALASQINKLIKAGADPNAYGQAALNLAIQRASDTFGQENIIALIAAGAKVQKEHLIMAIEMNYLGIIKTMLDNGALIDEKVIRAAVERGDTGVAKEIIKRIAHRPGNDMRFMLDIAIENDETEVANLLLKNGIRPSNPRRSFQFAVEHDYYGSMKLLIKNGMVKNADLDRALYLASRIGEYDTIDFLVKSGAKLCPGVLNHPVRDGYVPAIKMLLKAGADPKHISVDCFVTACSHGWIEAVRTVVPVANFSKKNIERAIGAASMRGQVDVVNYLISFLDASKKP